MAEKIERYLSNMQQYIILSRRMEIFFKIILYKIQLHHYARNSISSVLDLTTILRIFINCNILWQIGIYPVPSDSIPSGNGFIHTYGILRMIVRSTVFVEVGNMVITKHTSILFNLKFVGQGGGCFQYISAEKVSLNLSRNMLVFLKSASGVYLMTTVLHSSSHLPNSKRFANIKTPWNRNTSSMSLNALLTCLISSKLVLSKE